MLMRPNVRLGSKADVHGANADVR